MAKNKRTYESYPRDSFDDPPAGPVGVHRGKPSLASRATPYVVVFVVAVLAGLLAWSVFSGSLSNVLPWNSQADSNDGATQSETTDQGDDATDGEGSGEGDDSNAGQTDPGDDTGDDTDDTEEPAEGDDTGTSDDDAAAAPAANVNKATAVRVVNAAGINGYAASKAEVLKQQGYTNVTAANPSGSVPQSTVVWYENEADAATAQDVAQQLGITSVSQMSGISSPIVVVLRD